MTASSPIGSETQQWVMPTIEVANSRPPVEVVDQVDDVIRVGRLQRWQLTEPVRLFLYAALLVITAGLQLAGWATDEWVEFTAVNGALLLGLGATAEAVRANVYSPAGVIRASRAAAAAAVAAARR